jgi:hypothetical protein
MKAYVRKVKEFDDGNKGFNLLLDIENLQILIPSFRVTKGYINPPAIKSKKKFYGVTFFDVDVLQAIYSAVDKAFPGVLREFTVATGPIAMTPERIDLYLKDE